MHRCTTATARVLGVLTAFWCSNDLAQDGLSFERDATYLACLTPAASERGSPEYPPRQLAMRNGAKVVAEMTFDTKDGPPSLKLPIEKLNGNLEEFTGAVEEYAKRYRLPCLDKGKVTLTQTFNFIADSRKIVTGSPEDTTDSMAASGCQAIPPSGKPAFPVTAASSGGAVFLELKFEQAEAAPQLRVIYNGRSPGLAQSAASWAKGYRLRCAKALVKPIVATQKHIFFGTDTNLYALKDLGFVDFLRSVQRSDLTGARFDFNTMSCPFDLRVTLFQPYDPNRVVELESHDANRQPLLDWMSRLKFVFKGDSERYLIGESLNVTVPCMVLDLS
jgi:hypothetical protein